LCNIAADLADSSIGFDCIDFAVVQNLSHQLQFTPYAKNKRAIRPAIYPLGTSALGLGFHTLEILRYAPALGAKSGHSGIH